MALSTINQTKSIVDTQGFIVNENVNNQCSAHGVFLESGMLKIYKPNSLNYFWLCTIYIFSFFVKHYFNNPIVI